MATRCILYDYDGVVAQQCPLACNKHGEWLHKYTVRSYQYLITLPASHNVMFSKVFGKGCSVSAKRVIYKGQRHERWQ